MKNKKHKLAFFSIIILAVLICVPTIYHSLQFWENVSEAKPTSPSWPIVPPLKNSLLSIDERSAIFNFIMKHNRELDKADINRIAQKVSEKNLKWMILSIMKVESHFSPQVYSIKTVRVVSTKKVKGKQQVKYTTKKVPLAIGLMGVNVCNIEELKSIDIIQNESDLYIIEKNIDAGNYMLEEYLKLANGNTKLALKYYFNGPSNVKKFPNREDYNKYADDVFKILGEIISNVESAKLIKPYAVVKEKSYYVNLATEY